MNSKIYQQFIEETFEAMQHYQDDSDSSYFFVELPYIDTNKFNRFCSEHAIDLQVSYCSMETILQENNDYISPNTVSLFTNGSFQNFIQRHIESSDPIPIKARYAVICIYTTPTNYRTMGAPWFLL